MSILSDRLMVTGSSRAGTFDIGWTMWFKSWRRWRGGSALHRAVHAGPQGSSFALLYSP